MAATLERIHATAIAIETASGWRAALLRGAPGSGKSDLALRCLGLGPTPLLPYQARLVADDQVIVERRDGGLYASAPPTIAGKLEVRGIGIIAAGPLAQNARIVLAADLTCEAIERMPDPWPILSLLGADLPLLRLHAHEASAPLKLLLALASPALPPNA